MDSTTRLHRPFGLLCLVLVAGVSLAQAQTQTPPSGNQPPPDRSRDRGDGLPTSMFGTYIRSGELLVYPFYEHYRDRNFEYSPSELGLSGDADYRGRYRANEALVLLAYGVSDRVAVEFEMAVISAALDKDPADRSLVPNRVKESGVGDIEGQIRWRWNRESDRRPEFFSYAELVVPHHRERVLIGTPGWEVKYGTGLVRGFSWGTLTLRGAIEYDEASSSQIDGGEYAVEYLRRLSPRWRIYAGLEGTTDEISIIGEAQLHLSSQVFIKLNNGIGITSKATDWAPEIGVVFSFGRPR